jgi:EF-P beta-lysylation protein EpmB
MKTAIRSGVELCRRLQLGPSFEPAARLAERVFPVFAPLGFVAKMRPADPGDPLLRQVLPLEEELFPRDGYSRDPVRDADARIEPGLLQKYHGRVLVIATGTCAIHCRYCFRREYPYHDVPAAEPRWQAALARIWADPTIEEVILSGGDPLTISDDRLAGWAAELAAIHHVRRLRIHSRLPIVIPERITDSLLAWLGGTRLTPVFVIHANHPRELADDVAAALTRISQAGIPLLNQAVLLRGVNDDVTTLAALSRRLIDLRVMPYYLHQLDRVSGAAHFEVPVERGKQLVAQLRARLPGYAVPRYVQEIPGEASKFPLADY